MLLREAGMARNQGDSHLGVFAFFVKEGEGLNQEPGGGGAGLKELQWKEEEASGKKEGAKEGRGKEEEEENREKKECPPP